MALVVQPGSSTEGPTQHETIPSQHQVRPQTGINTKKLHKCAPCAFETYNFNTFNWHINKFHQGKYFLQCANCSQNLYSKGAYRIHINKCQAKPTQALPYMETASVDFSPTIGNCVSKENKPLDIITDLCIELEGKHRASKVLIDTVVSKVQDVLDVCGTNLSLDEMASNYSRKKKYTELGFYIKPEECILENGNSAK